MSFSTRVGPFGAGLGAGLIQDFPGANGFVPFWRAASDAPALAAGAGFVGGFVVGFANFVPFAGALVADDFFLGDGNAILPAAVGLIRKKEGSESQAGNTPTRPASYP